MGLWRHVGRAPPTIRQVVVMQSLLWILHRPVGIEADAATSHTVDGSHLGVNLPVHQAQFVLACSYCHANIASGILYPVNSMIAMVFGAIIALE